MNKVAVNTFSDGLITDLNPLSTPNTVLTDCLNGTIITYNGNEFTLQNDLGNVKMENIFFPTGYVPVGMEEYGGIIYVALFSPSTNKCEIGSFPSPKTITFGLENEKQTTSINGSSLKTDKHEMVKILKPLFEMTDKLNPGDQYRITILETGTDVSVFDQSSDNRKFKIKYFYQTEDGKITPVEYSDIYKADDNTFGYFKGTSGAIILVSYEIESLDYFNANITAESNSIINIAAKGAHKSLNLFKGVQVKVSYSDTPDSSIIRYYTLGSGIYDQEISNIQITDINDTKNINIELNPYSDYGYFKDKSIKRTYSPQDVAKMSSDLNSTFKYYVDSNNIKIDFNFKYNSQNLDLFVEVYDPWSDVSTIKKIDDPTPYGINTVLFDLVDEPRKKETPETSLGGIPMNKVETKIIGGDNDYNKEKYHAVIPVPKSGENFIYVRKSSELRKNHYYIIRISLVETDSTGINTYKYFLKSLYTMDIMNQYFNTIDDFETISMNIENAVSLDYKLNTDNASDSPIISGFDEDSQELITGNDTYKINDTEINKEYFYSSEYNTKRNIDLDITYNSSSIFGDFKSNLIELTPSANISSNSELLVEESFDPVVKIGSTQASTNKDLGKSSILIDNIVKDGFKYKFDLNYKAYRNISANKYQDYKTVNYFQEFPIRSALLLPQDFFSGSTFNKIEGGSNRFQKGSCASLKEHESNGISGTLYPTKNGSLYTMQEFSGDFDDNLHSLITTWRGNVRRNISAYISNIVTDQYYFLDTFSSNTTDSVKYGKDYPKEKRVSWRNCMLVFAYGSGTPTSTTSFVRVHNYDDIIEFFNSVYICAINPSNKYIYYPNSSTIQSVSNGTSTFKQKIKVNASISQVDQPMFEFYSRKDGFVSKKDFNDTSIKSFVNHLNNENGLMESTIVSTQVGSNKYIFPITSQNNLINKDIFINLSDYSMTKSSNPIVGGVLQNITNQMSLGGQSATERINILPPTNNGGLFIKDNKAIKLKGLLDYINVTGIGGSDVTQEVITQDSFLLNFIMKSKDSNHRGRWRDGEDGPNLYDDYVYES